MTQISQVQERIDFIIPRIKKKSKNPIIIDLGCGTGILSKEIYERLGVSVTGIDLDEENIRISKKNCKGNKYLCMDINEIKNKERADIIICSEVLEHLEDPGRLLNSINKCLKEDGKIIITIPNGYGPWEIFENQPLEIIRNFIDKHPKFEKKYFRLRDKLKLGAEDSKNSSKGSRHVQRFTMKKAKKLFMKSGFRVLESKNINFFSSILPFRMIRRKISFIYWMDKYISKMIPFCIASGWGFILEKRK